MFAAPSYIFSVRLYSVGVQDVFGCSGPAWDLLAKYGLDAATICKTAHEMLNK